MKSSVILLLFLAASTVTAFSDDGINISSRFEDGYFITRCKVKINASDAVVHKMMDDFIRQNKYRLDSLFTWALKDLKLQGEEGELLEYNLKSTKYAPETDIIHGKMDVKIPGIYTVSDFSIDTRVTKNATENGQVNMHFEVVKAAAFVKTATVTLKVVRIDEKSAWCTLESKISFGWFFNIFITQKRYKETAEWRFKQLMANFDEFIPKQQ